VLPLADGMESVCGFNILPRFTICERLRGGDPLAQSHGHRSLGQRLAPPRDHREGKKDGCGLEAYPSCPVLGAGEEAPWPTSVRSGANPSPIQIPAEVREVSRWCHEGRV
jgi:hypothetical protein